MPAPVQNKVLDIVLNMLEQYSICDRCLGRQFAWLSTGTSNTDRGHSLKLTLSMMADDELKSGNSEYGQKVLALLAGHGLFVPAQAIADRNMIEYDKNEECHLCYDGRKSVFDRISEISQRAINLVKDIEFDNFLVGTIPNPQLDERQDDLRAKYSLLHAEVLKSDFSRELGKYLHEILKKEVEFERPHLVFIYNMVNDKVRLQINPVFIFGRYQKLVRGIPQSRWDCKKCRGKGCKQCNGTGRLYPDSISEYIGNVAQRLLKGTKFKFHAAGREDIDVLMLGDGRPFVVEVSEPRVRTPDLKSLMKIINKESKKRIRVKDLKITNREQSQKLKEDSSTNIKEYVAIIQTESPVEKSELRRVEAELSENEIEQRTPNRVSHRRSDLVRRKMVHEVRLKKLKNDNIEAFIKVQGGTYVKELISGDDGRTEPSIASKLGVACVCKKLDVIAVYSGKE
ncbi:MAG: tRNA pseudouridine(54/55) synthase Pus10 [Candidatus Thorarchaeota archaeon]